MPEKIQEYIKDKWNMISTRNQCQRGRTLALKWLEKEYEDQYAHLRGYVQEILYSNPESIALVDTTPNSVGQDVFSRFYVCFDILRKTWRGTCRPVIGVDGTFLKVAVKGVLLTAVGHDANNQIYPIAWAVVQSEDGPNWLWFMQHLKRDLGLRDGDGFVILSDRSKGLISAVKNELPGAEHRKCVKHIVDNLKKKHGTKDLMKPMIWNLAWSYNISDYEENLKKIKDYSITLHDDVVKEEPHTWCRAFFKIGSCCEDVDNNATESFNATITQARAKAMVPMLEMIRRQAMERIVRRNVKANNYESLCSKYVRTTLKAQKKDADKCTTYTATHGLYEVHLNGNAHRVNMLQQTCTCRKWQLSGIPCEHGYGVIIDNDLDAEDYVSKFFSKFLWCENYETSNIPLRGPKIWMNSGLRLIVAPPPPDLPGRKKEKKNKKFPRKKGKHESPKKKKHEVQKLSREGRICHCSNCGETGHNITRCKLPPKKKMKTEKNCEGTTSQATPSQATTPQATTSQGTTPQERAHER